MGQDKVLGAGYSMVITLHSREWNSSTDDIEIFVEEENGNDVALLGSVGPTALAHDFSRIQ